MFKNKFKMILLLVVALLPVLAVFAQDEGAPVAWPDLGGREIAVAMTNDYPPYQYYDESNELVGWDYDTIRDICELINCVRTVIETSWAGERLASAAGELDVGTAGITYTVERDETVDFPRASPTYDQRLLVRQNETRLPTPEEPLAIPD